MIRNIAGSWKLRVMQLVACVSFASVGCVGDEPASEVTAIGDAGRYGRDAGPAVLRDAGGSGSFAGTGGGDAGASGSFAGMGGDAGASGSFAGIGGGDASEIVPPVSGQSLVPNRCSGDATETAMIGDSYLALSGEITSFLQRYSGQTYRPYYVSGTQMVGGLPPSIPDQYRLALAQGEVQTLIMDGGGNDVLLGDITCHGTGPAGPASGSPCALTIQRVAQAAAALLSEAAAGGVKEVIYFGYPHVAGFNADLNPSLDYAVPLLAAACTDAALDCTFIDVRADFTNHPEYIGLDGIHPTTPGSEAIAKRVWAALQDNCAHGVTLY